MTKTELPNAPSPAQASPRAKWPWVVGLVLVAAAVGLFFIPRSKPAGAGGRERFGGGPPSVATATVEQGSLKVYVNALGLVTALNTVTVRSRAQGELQKIHFTEGQLVKAGDLLAEIDPRAYRVALEQAEGTLARDQALLENARRDLERYQGAEAAVTQQQVDTVKASVAQYEGTVKTDQGSVDSYKLQLSYCRITAPITGRVGLQLVNEGNLIQASDSTGIVVLIQDQPISVVFSIPEENLPQVRKALAAGEKLPAEAYDSAMKKRLAIGELAAIDNQIDPTTGTIRLKASFANDDRELFPNQFVNVRLLTEVLDRAVLIPATAIQIGAQSRAVFVVKDGTVERRAVTLGQSEGEKTVVTTGLTPGEVVVIDGLDKLQDGGKVLTRAGGGGAGGGMKSPGADGKKRGRGPKQTP